MRTFVVVMDDTHEFLNALRFASGRAAATGSGITVLAVIEPVEFQHWAGVAEAMKAEAETSARRHFEIFAKWMKGRHGHEPNLVIRSGDKTSEVLDYIKTADDAAVLVLGAAAKDSGPGPIVSEAMRIAGGLPIPLTVVPGNMTAAEIDRIC